MLFAFLTGSEIILVVFAVVILFGATRIPQLGDALGKGIHNFRKSVTGKDETKELSSNTTETKAEPETK